MTQEELNKIIKQQEDAENTLESIYDRIGPPLCGQEADRITIAKTVQRLPREVREFVFEKVLFIVAQENKAGTFAKLKMNREKEIVIIILNYPSTWSEKEKMNTIAHEIAHCYLGHNHFNGSVYTDEIEADQLVEEWGFNRFYDSYDHLKR